MWLLSTCCLFGAITFQTEDDINYPPDWHHSLKPFTAEMFILHLAVARVRNGNLLQTQLEAILILFGGKS